MQTFKQKLTSRKFLLALAGTVFVILNEGFGLGVPKDAYNWIAGFIISYIAGESVVDVARSKNY